MQRRSCLSASKMTILMSGATLPESSETYAFRPIFDTLNGGLSDCQRLAKTANGLGTTFLIFLVLFSCLLPQCRRQSNSRRHKRLVRLTQHLTAQYKALALKHGLDFLEIIQTAQDLRPLPGFAFFLQALFQRALEQQRQKTAEYVAANGLVAFVIDGSGFQNG